MGAQVIICKTIREVVKQLNEYGIHKEDIVKIFEVEGDNGTEYYILYYK